MIKFIETACFFLSLQQPVPLDRATVIAHDECMHLCQMFLGMTEVEKTERATRIEDAFYRMAMHKKLTKSDVKHLVKELFTHEFFGTKSQLNPLPEQLGNLDEAAMRRFFFFEAASQTNSFTCGYWTVFNAAAIDRLLASRQNLCHIRISGDAFRVCPASIHVTGNFNSIDEKVLACIQRFSTIYQGTDFTGRRGQVPPFRDDPDGFLEEYHMLDLAREFNIQNFYVLACKNYTNGLPAFSTIRSSDFVLQLLEPILQGCANPDWLEDYMRDLKQRQQELEKNYFEMIETDKERVMQGKKPELPGLYRDYSKEGFFAAVRESSDDRTKIRVIVDHMIRGKVGLIQSIIHKILTNPARNIVIQNNVRDPFVMLQNWYARHAKQLNFLRIVVNNPELLPTFINGLQDSTVCVELVFIHFMLWLSGNIQACDKTQDVFLAEIPKKLAAFEDYLKAWYKGHAKELNLSQIELNGSKVLFALLNKLSDSPVREEYKKMFNFIEGLLDGASGKEYDIFLAEIQNAQRHAFVMLNNLYSRYANELNLLLLNMHEILPAIISNLTDAHARSELDLIYDFFELRKWLLDNVQTPYKSQSDFIREIREKLKRAGNQGTSVIHFACQTDRHMNRLCRHWFLISIVKLPRGNPVVLIHDSGNYSKEDSEEAISLIEFVYRTFVEIVPDPVPEPLVPPLLPPRT